MSDDGLLDHCAVGLGAVGVERTGGEGMLLRGGVASRYGAVVLKSLVDEHGTVDIIYTSH